jgi:hypothetical protein
VLDLERFLVSFERRPGASHAAIAGAEEQLRVKLPREYVEFLRLTDGGEGFIGGGYAILWAVEELHSANQDYEFMKYVPGFLSFGSDGGGEAFGFDTRDSLWSIVEVPFIGGGWHDARPLGASFNAFLKQLYETEL